MFMNKLNYSVPINIFETFDDEFVITGVAINATTTDNNHKFLPEELRKSATSLLNRPLLSDHDDKLKSMIGRVIASEFDEIGNSIKFKAKINNTEQGKLAKQLIKAGDLNTASVGANVERFEEEDDVMIPMGIKFKELSLVATPADDDATFTLIQSLNKLHKVGKVGIGMEDPNRKLEISHSTEKSEDQLNYRRKIMEKKDTLVEEDESEKPEESEETKEEPEAEAEETEEKVGEMQKDLLTFKDSILEMTNQMKAQSNLLARVLKDVKTLQEADADEEKPEEESTEAEPEKEEVKVEPETEKEESDESEESEESDTASESGFKTIQGYKSFTIEKHKYK